MSHNIKFSATQRRSEAMILLCQVVMAKLVSITISASAWSRYAKAPSLNLLRALSERLHSGILEGRGLMKWTSFELR